MNCPKCGREITSNVCPYCSGGPVMVNSNYNNGNVTLNNTVPFLEQQPNTPVATVPANNQQSNNNQVIDNKNNNNGISFLVKYLIVTVIIIILTIVCTYLITRNSLEKESDNLTKEVYLNGYMYRMDKSLNTSIEDNRLIISDNLKDYRILISPSNISFDMYRDNLQYIKNLYIQKGYSIKNPKTKTFNGVEYLTMELFKNNTYELLAISRGNSKKTSYVMVIENGTNIIDYSILEKMSDIIKNIDYNSITNRKDISEDNMIDAHKVLIK